MTVGNEVIGSLLAINAILLGGIVTFQMKIWDAIDRMKKEASDIKDDAVEKREELRCELHAKRDIADCKHEQDKCFQLFDKKVNALRNTDNEIWDALGRHSHTGLPADTKVTR